MKFISRFSALVLILCLLMGATAMASASEMEDVFTEDWFYDYVVRGRELELINGTSESGFRFEPRRNMTRAEFIAVLGRTHEHLSGDTIELPRDVFFAPPPFWYTKYLIWAQEHEIILGDKTGNLRAYELITREQIAVFVHRYIEIFELQLVIDTVVPQWDPCDFYQVSSWAQRGVRAMIFEYQLMRGNIIQYRFLFRPLDNAHRAEVLAVLIRLVDAVCDSETPE